MKNKPVSRARLVRLVKEMLRLSYEPSRYHNEDYNRGRYGGYRASADLLSAEIGYKPRRKVKR